MDERDPDDLGDVYEHGGKAIPLPVLEQILASLEGTYRPNAAMRKTLGFTAADVKPHTWPARPVDSPVRRLMGTGSRPPIPENVPDFDR